MTVTRYKSVEHFLTENPDFSRTASGFVSRDYFLEFAQNKFLGYNIGILLRSPWFFCVPPWLSLPLGNPQEKNIVFDNLVFFHRRNNFLKTTWSRTQLKEALQDRIQNKLAHSSPCFALLLNWYIPKKIALTRDKELCTEFLSKTLLVKREFFDSYQFAEDGFFFLEEAFLLKKELWTDAGRERALFFSQSPNQTLYHLDKDERVWDKEKTTFTLLQTGNTLAPVPPDTISRLGNLPYMIPWLVRDEHFFPAPKCGHLLLKREKGAQIRDFCDVCWKKMLPTGALLNPYSTKVPDYLKPVNHPRDRKTRFGEDPPLFGIELEFEEATEKDLEAIYYNLPQFVICKRDASLSDTGAEIVTPPATFFAQKERLFPLFEKVLPQTRISVSDSCGMHIHVSKKSFTALQIGRLLEFIYNRNNQDFLEALAGRSENAYCSYEKSISVTYCAPETFNAESENRHTALNLQNKNTLEFRIFKSSLSYQRVLANLELVKALMDYTKPGNFIKINSLGDYKEKDLFLDFLKLNKKEYPYLISLCYELKEIPIPKKGNRKCA